MVIGAFAGRGRAGAFAIPMLTQFAFGTAIELGQLFSLDRTPSILDVVAQVLGAGAAALATFEFIPSSFRVDLRRWTRERPSFPFLLALAGALALEALFPYAITIDPSTVWHNVQAARAASVLGVAREAWPSAFLYEFLPYATLAALVLVAWLRSTAPRARITAWALAAGYGAALEAAKIFIVGRTAHLDRVLVAGAGALVGAALLPSLDRLKRVDRVTWFRAMAAVAFLYLIFRELAPLDFVGSVGAWREKAGHIEWVPFASYLGAPFLRGAFDIATKALLGAWLAFSWSGGAEVGPSMGRNKGRRRTALAVALLAVALEALQLFQRSHVAAITDVITIGAGGMVGSWVYGSVERAWADRL